jgi:CHAD domain-containing protein
METATEIERKYEVADDAVVPDLDGLGSLGEPEESELDAEYFDTADFSLARRRIVLRRRSGGSDAGWHIKLPASEGRTELHWPIGEGDVPEEVREAVRVHVRDRELRMIARIRTHRTTRHLTGDDGAALLEIADDTVSATDVAAGVVRLWREWEVELLAGAPPTVQQRTALLDAVEERLVAVGASPAESVAKLASALGRTSLDQDPEPQALSRSSPASAVIVRVLADLVEEVKRIDPAVRRDEPDAVHQLRTRVRRLRSVLGTFDEVIDAAATAPLREQLRALAAVLGEARDAEVMRDRTRTLVEDHQDTAAPAGRRLTGGFETAHALGVAGVRAMLSDARYYRLLDALDALVADPPLAAAGAAGREAGLVLPPVLAHEVGRVRKRAKSADRAETETERIELLHEVRKAAKRLRYAAEAVSRGDTAVLGGRARDLGAAAERIHDLLGEHRDSSLLQQHLRDTAGAGRHSFAYGVLYEVERHGAALCLADYPAALAGLERARLPKAHS